MKKRTLVITLLMFVTVVGLVTILWINNNTQTENSDVIIVNNPQTRQIEGIQAVDDLNDLSYSVSEDQFYLTSFDEAKIYILDAATFKIVGEVPFSSPHKLLVADNSSEIYVSAGGGKVVEASIETLNVTNQTQTGDRPGEMAWDSQRNNIFVVNEFSDNVSVIDRQIFKVIRTLKVGRRPLGIVVDRNNKYAYVSNDRDGTLSIISLDSLSVVGTIQGVGRPGKLLTYPNKNLILSLDKYNNQVHVIDQDTNKIVLSIDVVNLPVDMVLDPQSEHLYVISFTDSSIGVVDLASEKMKEVIQLGSAFDAVSGLNNIELDSKRNSLVVTNTNTGQVYMVKLE